MNKFVESLAIFVVGGLSYALLELIWRGRTHWTMIIAGGICLILMFRIYSANRNMSLFNRALVGALIITAVEFIFGFLFNYLLKMDIWDYSDKKFNVMGQICLMYTILWGLLSVPVSFFCIKLKDIFERFNVGQGKIV